MPDVRETCVGPFSYKEANFLSQPVPLNQHSKLVSFQHDTDWQECVCVCVCVCVLCVCDEQVISA